MWNRGNTYRPCPQHQCIPLTLSTDFHVLRVMSEVGTAYVYTVHSDTPCAWAHRHSLQTIAKCMKAKVCVELVDAEPYHLGF